MYNNITKGGILQKTEEQLVEEIKKGTNLSLEEIKQQAQQLVDIGLFENKKAALQEMLMVTK